jgi:excisionase family DNA binding protein
VSYTLGQAAKAVGKSKPTIARAIKAGRISALRTETGEFAIDPAELHRVFQPASNDSGTMKQSVPGEGGGTSLAELRVERDRLLIEREDLRDTIRDLRIRLDASNEERRMLMGMLTAPSRGPWWRRWFR